METRDNISHTAAPDAERGASAADDVHLDEGDYVKFQADEAKAAIAATVAELKDKVKNMGDVREWTKKYPWIAAGVAIAAGFAAGATIVPTSTREAKEKWGRLKSRVTGHNGESDETDGKEGYYEVPPGTVFIRKGPRAEKEAEKAGWLALIFAELIKTVRPLLMSFLKSNFAARGEDGEEDDSSSDAAEASDH